MGKWMRADTGRMFVQRYITDPAGDDSKWEPIDIKSFEAKLVEAHQAEQQKKAWQHHLTMPQATSVTDPKPPPALTSQMFEDAIDHIKTHGWAQGSDATVTGQVCARGAFGLWVRDRQTGQVEFDMERMQAFNLRLTEIKELMGLGDFVGSVMTWNDMAGRTEAEVLEALMLAAKKLRDLGR